MKLKCTLGHTKGFRMIEGVANLVIDNDGVETYTYAINWDLNQRTFLECNECGRRDMAVSLIVRTPTFEGFEDALTVLLREVNEPVNERNASAMQIAANTIQQVRNYLTENNLTFLDWINK